MATTDEDDHGHSHDRAVESITDYVHDNSWSVNLETPTHADDRERIVEHAIDAIEHTTADHHVNLVTHGDQGHPRQYLYDVLDRQYGDAIEWEYVEQCGCGGYVTRVTVERDQ